jgi:hypothetical protein
METPEAPTHDNSRSAIALTFRLLDLVFWAMFLIAVAHLFFSKLDVRTLILFLLPPLVALAFRHRGWHRPDRAPRLA